MAKTPRRADPAEYTKEQLDGMTGKAAEIVSAARVSGLHAAYAAKVAEMLATQFPGVPELPRITLACAHYMSAIGAEGIHSAILVRILADAGLQLGEQADGEAPDAP